MSIESFAILAGLVVILVSVVMYLRSQRGTAGPTVGRVPRFLRPVTNAWFGVMDWPIPFDRDREVIPVEERRRAKDD
jgi:hypothetical protein